MAYFFDILKTILFGIVEGITEWLPISSTGHLLILQSMVGEIISHDFMEMFDVVIQLGAILAVVVIYFNKLNPFSSKKTAIEKQNTINLWIKVIVACLPAAVIGLLLDDWLDAHLFKTSVVAVTLILYGIAFIVVEERHRGKKFKYIGLKYTSSFCCYWYRYVSGVSTCTRYISFRCYNSWWYDFRCIKICFCRIYILPCYTGNVWCFTFKTC